MKQRFSFNYTNPSLNIGLNTWRDVYLLQPTPVQLFAEVRRGKLVYRAKGSNKRISYSQVKAGLLKKACHVEVEVPSWLLK